MINNFDLYQAFKNKAETLTLPYAYDFIRDDEKTNLTQDNVSIVETMLDQDANVNGLPDNSGEFLRGIYQLGVYVPKSNSNGGNTAKSAAQSIKTLFLRVEVEKNSQKAKVSNVYISQLMADDTHYKVFVSVNFTAVG